MYSRSVPVCDGIVLVGIGGESVNGGTMTGMIPYTAYFARIRATLAAIGRAGYGIFICITSINTLKSSPVTVSVDWPGSLLGVNSWRVTIPSISTLGIPFIVAIITTLV